MRNDSLRSNPLFIAIAYKLNDIAVRILVGHPELNKVYSNEYVRDCDLLQWCVIRDNVEMFSIIKNGL